MKTEYYPVLIPDEGMMLYNGEIYSDKVYPQPETIGQWREVPMEQYENWLKSQNSDDNGNEETNTAE